MAGRGYRRNKGDFRSVRTVAPSARMTGESEDVSDIVQRSARASSAFPTLNESMRSLSVSEASAKETRSKSVRQRLSRRTLCSAVPDLANLTPVHRPDEGGHKGRSVDVYTNHFRVDIEDATVYQYDIEIVMINRSGKPCQARKDDRWEVMQTIIKQRKHLPTIWYDEGKTVYSKESLPDLGLPIEISLTKEEVKKFCLTKCNLVQQSRIQSIHDYIRRKTTTRPQEAIRIIETLFKQRAQSDLISIRNQFYDRRRELEDMNDGRGMAKGFYQALFLTRNGPTLNINLTFTCFYMPMKFVDFICKYLRRDITRGVRQNELDLLAKSIRNLQIETMHTGRRIFYRFHGFGRPADQIKFHRNESEDAASVGEEISVAQYFAQQHKRKLMFPSLPCINAIKGNQNKPNWLPMEVVSIVEWQRAVRPLDKTQRGAVSKNSILRPDQRYEEIMKIVRNNQFDRDRYLHELNIQVHDKEMLKVKARIITPPKITYRQRGRGEIPESIQGGQWRIRNWFMSTPPINNWGIIYFGDTPDRNVNGVLQEFQNQFPSLLGRTGFIINSQLSLTIRGTSEHDIMTALQEAAKNKWQLAIIVLKSYDSARVYDYVKQSSNRSIGLMTQCVNYQALERNISKLNMYVENISQKINGKLGGINGVVNIKSALSRPSNEDLFMFFGADVTHSTCSTESPSIAAVVGSRDATNSLYAARLCEQYPKKGRCSVEIIKELGSMVTQLLQLFADAHGGCLPNKIVFYRDGVDDGQYQKVLDYEVTQIKTACRQLYPNGFTPQLTFIVVKKRHNTRFFLYESDQTLNVEPGTVIDQDITHPFQFDFYLCSQKALKGTSRPTLYHVVHDDNQFTSDDIQQLTYWLCHTDMRCTKSVSIPAPVHYAHLAAYASRALRLEKDENIEGIDGGSEDPEDYCLDDIKTELMMLDTKIADDMWFL